MTLTKVIHPDKVKFQLTSDHIFYPSFLISMIGFMLYYVFDVSLTGFIAVIAVQFLPTSIITTIWSRNEYFPKRYSPQGSIMLSLSEISIDGQKYNVEDLDCLIFDINDFKGKRIRFSGSLTAGPSLAQGDRNFIGFNYKGNEIRVQFLLKSKEEFMILGEYLTELFENGVSFKETLTGGRSYGLELLNYKEIQEYKRRKATKIG